jgi:hypothetical protein
LPSKLTLKEQAYLYKMKTWEVKLQYWNKKQLEILKKEREFDELIVQWNIDDVLSLLKEEYDRIQKIINARASDERWEWEKESYEYDQFHITELIEDITLHSNNENENKAN